MITFRGITWDHPRGLDPLRATAVLYQEAHPEVAIEWQVRTLQEFADFPVERLAERYDLLIIDHPFAGFAAASQCLLPLDQYLDAGELALLADQSVGLSHASYAYAGHQWALAVDAASQVSAYRPDLLERAGMAVPRTWGEVLALGRALREQKLGAIALPSIPIDALMSLCSICANAGEDPCRPDADEVVSRPMARYALSLLREMLDISHPESLDWNPPRTLERMSTSDEVVYCPLLFGYSNYARAGFRPHLVRFTTIPVAGARGVGGAILGGTGIAVSARCAHPEAAVAFAHWVCGADVQRGPYVMAGGQPGNRSAWTDPAVNAACNDYFRDTLPTLEAAYLRPRYNGVMEFQERASMALHAFLRAGGDDIDALIDELNRLYRASRQVTR